MKIVLLSACLAFSCHLQAQDWAPFTQTDKFNYKSDTAYLISANYFVDSVQTVGTDSIYYLNRIRKDVPLGWDSLLVYLDQAQYWGKRMTKTSDSLYHFQDPCKKT